MKYTSTRGWSGRVSAADALLQGLASDGGLFVPTEVLQMPLQRAPLPDVAEQMLVHWLTGPELGPALPSIIREAFTFDAPLVATRQPGTTVLELFHGPTAAFKDFGARFLAGCLRALKASGPKTVLVATSGDTGSAVASAFHRQPGVRVAVLYPKGRVSARQAHQLGCFGDNVHALVVEGTFDDCQRLVKQALADVELRAAAPLASANSVSLGRLLPQMTYFAHAALEHGGPLNIAVPTGNLGNAVACLLARAAGAPIGDVMLACNANRAVYEFVTKGSSEPRETIATLANAMDVGVPSNLERLRWLHPAPREAGIFSEWVDDETIRARIHDGESRYGRVFCPHTACAVEAVERRRKAGDTRDWAVVATAHPAKFETVVEPLVGHAVHVPPALAEMLARPSRAEPLANDDSALKAWLTAAGNRP